MNAVAKSRTIKTSIMLAAVSLVWWGYFQTNTGYAGDSILTGWILFASVSVLILLSLRKKLSFMPLGNVKDWLQVHLYLGVFAALIFPLHNQFSLPNGLFESSMYWLFWIICISGVFGIFISRKLPKKLAQTGIHVLLEDIPNEREKIKLQIGEILTNADGLGELEVVRSFYESKLKTFISESADFRAHVMDNQAPYVLWAQEFRLLHRYLNPEQISQLNTAEELTKLKVDLDKHKAIRELLRLWLFVHVPLSFLLLFAVLFHVFWVYSYWGLSL